MADWAKRMLELYDVIAGWSKDSTQTAAIITDDMNFIKSTGFNGFPMGCNDNVSTRSLRPAKYLYTEHAERNAIYAAARNGISLEGTTMYIRWFPCADCARAIIQSGISKLVCSKPNFDTPTWGVHFVAALEMLEESGVELIYLDEEK